MIFKVDYSCTLLASPHTHTHQIVIPTEQKIEYTYMMTRLHQNTSLLFIIWGAIISTTTSSTTTPRGLRTSSTTEQQPQKKQQYKRQSVIRRLYGPENGDVRKHVRLLEEKATRSQTGFLGDPNHFVEYKNHPYDKNSPTYVGRKRRELQEDTTNTTTTDTTTTTGTDCDYSDLNANCGQVVTEDPYKPLRIKFHTQALDDRRTSENAAKIDFIENKVLPA